MNIQQAITSFEEHIREEMQCSGFTMPKHKIVCPECEGEGTVGPGFVYTEADREEMGYEDFMDHMEDIRSGAYDQRCPQCAGRNVIDEVDIDKLDSAIQQHWATWLAEIQEEEDIQRMERMMGA